MMCLQSVSYNRGPVQVEIFESYDETNNVGLVGFGFIGVISGLMCKIVVFLWSWKSS